MPPPILVTLEGILIVVKLEQLLKQLFPIDVTLVGKFIVVTVGSNLTWTKTH